MQQFLKSQKYKLTQKNYLKICLKRKGSVLK